MISRHIARQISLLESGVKLRFRTPPHTLNVDFITPVINGGVLKKKVLEQPSLLEVYVYTMLNKKEGTDS